MIRKVIIEIRLGQDANGESAKYIGREIVKDFQEGFLKIPYGDRILKVAVTSTK